MPLYFLLCYQDADFRSSLHLIQPSGWLKHAGGVGRLIELRGPWQHKAPPERALLDNCRVTIALECLVEKKRCFLERHEWKTIPWALDPESKTSTHHIQDILCDIPGLMEDATNVQGSSQEPSEIASRHQRLSENILIHLNALYEWRTASQCANPGACHEVLAASSSPVQTQILSPTALHYSSLTAANEITLYNAILLLLLRLRYQILGPSSNAPITALHLPLHIDYGPLYPPGAAPNPRAVAMEICRRVEYNLLDSQNAGAFLLLFPLRLAFTTFDPGSRERIWVSDVMRGIANSSGFGIGHGLSGNEVVAPDS
jgi:hypothetical protein